MGPVKGSKGRGLARWWSPDPDTGSTSAASEARAPCQKGGTGREGCQTSREKAGK